MKRLILAIAALVIGVATTIGALVLRELGHFIDDIKGSD